MLTFRSLAAGAISEAAAYTAHLLEKTLPDEQMALAAYYGQMDGLTEAQAAGMGSIPVVRADIDPTVADVLGVKPGAVLTERELAHILSGRRADGADLPGNQRHVLRYKSQSGQDRFRTSGIDLCLSAPKSVSVAWAFASTEAERASIVQAHRDARDETLRHIEAEIAKGRVGQGGVDVELARLGWITIDHYTARATIAVTRPDPVSGVVGTEIHAIGAKLAGDPQLHSHNIMPNVMVTETGKVVSVNTKLLAGRIKEFGAVYQALLATKLRDIGIDVALDDKTHTAKLTVIPDEVCQEFSKRTRDAEEFARREAAGRGQDWDAMTADMKVDFLKGGAKASRRYKGDDLANLNAWADQAASMNWKHETAVLYGPPVPPLADEDRLRSAYETALPLVAEAFDRRAVIGASDLRLEAARGLIAAGIRSVADVGAVTKQMAQGGVKQNGTLTRLIWGETEDGMVKMTTALHDTQEKRLVALACGAAGDKSRALTDAQLAAGIARTRTNFRGAHGKTQADAMTALGTGGQFSVLVGVAGSGKTTLLTPLVDAWKERGDEVWGMALSRRQGDALRDAGVDASRALALGPFLDRLEKGEMAVGPRSVVVVDELGQVGTRMLLDLLERQAEHGFQIVAVGDDRQCQSIEAGPVIELLRDALGKDAIPEILTTVRQSTEREREITGLFRVGTEEAVGQALSMKREGATPTVELVPGDTRQAIARVAALAMERRAAAPNAGYTVTISAPTNAEAMAVGRAVRALRQTAGEVGPDRVTRRATDGRGSDYEITLSEGDQVRLFQRTRAVFGEGRDRREAHIGNNGTVLTVASVREDGLCLTGESGKVGFVSWDKLSDGGRLKVALGECLTIDSAQGITSDEHIFAMPNGSKSVQGFKAYVAASRHRVSSWIVSSAGAEKREIDNRRPLGVAEPITDDDMWKNVASNLARQPLRESATAFLKTVAARRTTATQNFQQQMRGQQAREARGEAATNMLNRVGPKRAVLAAIGQTVEKVTEKLERLIERFRKSSAYASAARNKPTFKARTAAERVAREDAGAATARQLIAGAKPADGSHPHLVAKGVEAHGLYVAVPGQGVTVRADDGSEQRHSIAGRLLVPLRDAAGEIRNIQMISADGKSLYLSGAQKTGVFHALGELRDGGQIVLGESYATVATLQKALGMTAVMGLDSNNLMTVAKALRALYPDTRIAIGSDNDHHLPRRAVPLPNVGLEKATAAATEIGGQLLVPQFESHDRGTDWNDTLTAAIRETGDTAKGLRAVRAALLAALQSNVEARSKLASASRSNTATL